MDRVLGSRDSVNGFTSQSQRSVFSELFSSSLFFFPCHVNSLSLTQYQLASEFGFYYCALGRQKENRIGKILAAPFAFEVCYLKLRSKCNEWERG